MHAPSYRLLLTACLLVLFSPCSFGAEPKKPGFDPAIFALIDKLEPETADKAEALYAKLKPAAKKLSAHALAIVDTQHGRYEEAAALLKPSHGSTHQPNTLRLRLWLACETNDHKTIQDLFLALPKSIDKGPRGAYTAWVAGGLSDIIRSSSEPERAATKELTAALVALQPKAERAWQYAPAFEAGRAYADRQRVRFRNVLDRLAKSGEDPAEAAVEAEKEWRKALLDNQDGPMKFLAAQADLQAINGKIARAESEQLAKTPGQPSKPREQYTTASKSKLVKSKGQRGSPSKDDKDDDDKEVLTPESERAIDEYEREYAIWREKALKDWRVPDALQNEQRELNADLARLGRNEPLQQVQDAHAELYCLRFLATLEKEHWSTALNHPAAYGLLNFAAEHEELSLNK